jgi:hypothetical protein
MPVLTNGTRAGAHDPGHVDPDRGAAELEDRDLEVGVLAERDRVHRPGRVSASAAWPPTNRTIAGAAAIANPPTPAVSVMVESPMSGLASSRP